MKLGFESACGSRDTPMRRTQRVASAFLLAILTSTTGPGRADDGSKPAVDAGTPALTMTPAVACVSIAGFEDYEPLPGAALSSDEKLLVYYRPLRYRTEADGSGKHIHLVQDGQIRRRGEKKVLMFKARMLDYEWKSNDPELPVYLRNTVALKGLKPGDYDYDIILRDLLAPGTPTARQTLAFKVVPPGLRDAKGDVKPSDDRPTSP